MPLPAANGFLDAIVSDDSAVHFMQQTVSTIRAPATFALSAAGPAGLGALVRRRGDFLLDV